MAAVSNAERVLLDEVVAHLVVERRAPRVPRPLRLVQAGRRGPTTTWHRPVPPGRRPPGGGDSGVALGALGLLEERVGGAGGADVALATLRAELTHCEWELSESKVGIGQAEETVALATMRGELRSVEAQLTATASLLSWARAARFAAGERLKATPISLTD